MTAWARDVFYGAWIRADQAGLDQAAADAEAAARAEAEAEVVVVVEAETEVQAARAEAEASVEPAAALAGDAGPDVTTAA